MPRIIFDRQLKELQDDVLTLGSMVERAVTRSVEALKARDVAAAHQIVADDAEVNHKRFEIEEKCVELIATQQPMAHDLRTIIGVLNIVTELERMGDHAAGIAKITVMMGGEPLLKPLIDIPRMAEKATEMLRRSLHAFIAGDADEARRICEMDDEVDSLYDQVFRELLTYMMADPGTVTKATYLIWVAHNLERTADRVTNICERVAYMVTGRMEEIGASKY